MKDMATLVKVKSLRVLAPYYKSSFAFRRTISMPDILENGIPEIYRMKMTPSETYSDQEKGENFASAVT